MTEITIKATDGSGEFFAYVARPKATPAGAVVVIQEIFGVSPAMRAITDAIADQGFIGVCPDLFWRLEPRVSLTDKTQAEWDKAMALLKAFDQDKGWRTSRRRSRRRAGSRAATAGPARSASASAAGWRR